MFFRGSLALYTEIDQADIPEIISKINEALEKTEAKIHIRNGVAIIGQKDGSITLINKVAPENPDRQIAKLRTELAAANKRTDTAKLARKTLQSANSALSARVAQLENDVQTALGMAEENVDKAALEAATEKNARLSEELASLMNRLATSNATIEKAGEALSGASERERRLLQQLQAANARADAAEEAKAAAFKARDAAVKAIPEILSPEKPPAELTRSRIALDSANRLIATLRTQLRAAQQKTNPDSELAARADNYLEELIKGRRRILALESELAALHKKQTTNAPAEKTDSPELAAAEAEIKRLRSELAETTTMLESLTGPAAPQADTANIAQATDTNPEPKTPASEPAKQRPAPAPARSPLQKLKSGECGDISSLLATTKGAIVLACGKNGLQKKAIREIRDALTGIPDLKSLTHTARTKLVKALADLREKGNGDTVSEAEVQKFLRTVDGIVSSQN